MVLYPNDLVLGEVGDEEIDYQFFEQRVQQSFDAQKSSNPQVNIDQVRNSVWNQIVRESILSNQFDALGLLVSSSELFDMVQGKIHIQLLNNRLQTQRQENSIEKDYYNF